MREIRPQQGVWGYQSNWAARHEFEITPLCPLGGWITLNEGRERGRIKFILSPRRRHRSLWLSFIFNKLQTHIHLSLTFSKSEFREALPKTAADRIRLSKFRRLGVDDFGLKFSSKLSQKFPSSTVVGSRRSFFRRRPKSANKIASTSWKIKSMSGESCAFQTVGDLQSSSQMETRTPALPEGVPRGLGGGAGWGQFLLGGQGGLGDNFCWYLPGRGWRIEWMKGPFLITVATFSSFSKTREVFTRANVEKKGLNGT